MTEPPSISVVIPVWNAQRYLPELIPLILGQTGVNLKEILLLDSMSTDETVKTASGFEKVRVIPEPEFSHGETRNRGIREASEELVVLMTQDAQPEPDCFAQLANALTDPTVAYAFSRQLPYPGTNPMECYYHLQRFSETPRRFESKGDPVTNPQEAFCSNVCSLLRKSVALDHPFRSDLIMGEDQEWSRRIQENGHAVQYVPEAVVTHSHNYPLLTLFRRYFDSVVAVTQIFPERNLTANASSGIFFLKRECRFLARHHPLWLLYYPFYLSAKTLATLLAHHADRLPTSLKLWCSLNKTYWRIIPHPTEDVKSTIT
jgi:rhamnosyltransferase